MKKSQLRKLIREIIKEQTLDGRFDIVAHPCNGYGDYKNYVLQTSQGQAAWDAGHQSVHTIAFLDRTWDNGNSIPQIDDWFWARGIVWKVAQVNHASYPNPTQPFGNLRKANADVGNGEWCNTHYVCTPGVDKKPCQKIAMGDIPFNPPVNLTTSFANKEACMNKCGPVFEPADPIGHTSIGTIGTTGTTQTTGCYSYHNWPPTPSPTNQPNCTHVCIPPKGIGGHAWQQTPGCQEIASSIAYTSAAGSGAPQFANLQDCQSGGCEESPI